MRKFLSVLLAMAMVFSLSVTSLAAEDTGAAAPAATATATTSGDVTVLYTNDVHTYVTKDIKYSTVAAYKDSLKDVLLVDAGDHIQGTAYGSMDNGATIVKLMEAAGYDLATIGNHEFDYGMTRALEVITKSTVPYVSCNFYNEKNGVAGDLVLDAYKVFEVGGMKIAFVGITTPESFTKSTPAYFQNEKGEYIYGIAGGTDGKALYAAVQKAVDAAAKEADYVIALGHLGDDPASDPWNSEDVIANVSGLSAFIDGHSHSTVPMKEVKDKDGKTVVLTQTGSYFAALGQMTITKDGKITTKLLKAEDLTGVTPDADVKAIEDKWVSEVTTKLNVKIGSFADTMTNYAADGETRLVRKQETNVGDFCADALYDLFEDMGMDVDLAVMNGGGIRNKTTAAGDVTYLTCKDIHTFGNVACLITVTGQQVLDALEWGAKDAPNECGGFLQVSGVKYTVNTAIPSTVQKDEKGVWTGSPTGEYRVTDVQILNNETGEYEALKLDAKYNMAGYNYTLRNLGDGFNMFDGAVNVLDYVSEDYMVLASYIKSFKDGKVTGYAEPQGRILMNPFADVKTSSWYGDYVIDLYSDGIISGTSATTYAPNDTLTWAAALKLLLVSNGNLKSEDATGADWSKNTIAKAAELGLVAADLDGTKAISRLEFCQIAAKLNKLAESKTESVFTDCKDAYVMALVDAKVINGMTATTFEPDASLTRAQIAKIIYQLNLL